MTNFPPPPPGAPGPPPPPNQPPPAPSAFPPVQPPPASPFPPTAAFPPVPPGPPGPPAPPVPGSSGPSGNRRPALIGAAILAVAVLVIGGVYLATKGGDDDSAHLDPGDRTGTTDVTESTEAETTTAPSTSAVPLTLPPTIVPTTTMPPSTTAAGVPEGALDLGYGVYFPIPAGWSQTDTSTDDAPTITNGDTSLTLQALARPAGEDPLTLLQEYVNTFDDDFDAVSYNPSEQYDRIDGAMPIDAYGLTYRTYDSTEDDGIGLTGLAEVFVRGDGLSVVYDVFSTIEKYDVDGEAYGGFVDSMVAAPALGAAVDLTNRETFRVTSAHELVPAFGLAGYTITPAWHTKQRADGNTYASNDDGDFEMRRFDAVGTADGGVAAAQAYYTTMYPNVTFTAATPGDPNFYGHERRDFSWNGTLDDGTEFAGVGTVWFDPTTTNAVAIFEDWYGNIDNPYYADFNFMFVAASDSFATI